MQSRFEMIEDVGARGTLVYARASLVFYGATMLAVLLFARPLETVDAAAKAKAPAAEASVSKREASRSFWQPVPPRAQQTASQSKSLKPARAEALVPFKQL